MTTPVAAGTPVSSASRARRPQPNLQAALGWNLDALQSVLPLLFEGVRGVAIDRGLPSGRGLPLGATDAVAAAVVGVLSDQLDLVQEPQSAAPPQSSAPGAGPHRPLPTGAAGASSTAGGAGAKGKRPAVTAGSTSRRSRPGPGASAPAGSTPAEAGPKLGPEHWLCSLESSVRHSLKVCVVGALTHAWSSLQSGEDQGPMVDQDWWRWLVQAPSQVVLLAFDIAFTSTLGEAMRKPSSAMGVVRDLVQLRLMIARPHSSALLPAFSLPAPHSPLLPSPLPAPRTPLPAPRSLLKSSLLFWPSKPIPSLSLPSLATVDHFHLLPPFHRSVVFRRVPRSTLSA